MTSLDGRTESPGVTNSTVPTGEAGVAIADASVLLASCNAALDDCSELTGADIKLIARALKDVLTQDRSPYQACFELQQRQVEELVLALMWCKPRLKHEAYQRHIEWTLTKYPKPPRVDEPRIVRSDDYRDFCPSDPRGPGRTGGE